MASTRKPLQTLRAPRSALRIRRLCGIYVSGPAVEPNHRELSVENIEHMVDNKLIVTRFVEELWNERRLEVADIIFDENCHTHQLQSGSPIIATPRGPAAVKAHVGHWLSGFPDLKFTVEQMFAEEERVFSQLAMDGTQMGHWMGIPPTRRHINIKMITIHNIRSGKIIEDWVLVESLGLLQQLGALPPTNEILSQFAQRHETPA